MYNQKFMVIRSAIPVFTIFALINSTSNNDANISSLRYQINTTSKNNRSADTNKIV